MSTLAAPTRGAHAGTRAAPGKGLGDGTSELWTYIDLHTALQKIENQTDTRPRAYRGAIQSINQELTNGIAEGVAQNGLNAQVISVPGPGDVPDYQKTEVTSEAPEGTVRSFVASVRQSTKEDAPSGGRKVSQKGVRIILDHIRTGGAPDRTQEVVGDYSGGGRPLWYMRQWPLVHWQKVTSGGSGGSGGGGNGGSVPPNGEDRDPPQIIAGVSNSTVVIGTAGATAALMIAVAAS